mmetsp:Transcript_6273/g.11904  ORF Transcript_6273/g.11904 Transcript_6273/m.11904 type:complete len:246 (+) Transcript_6273:48-785(+)|eukprot:CAMPEP_0175156892 /NCGR_PEP_ID=MMETSP0087-20121206/21876_1 /TAXON_ID=136419 /ORGANISM="Unknown Unknown, Strain D1" /LENGTH=245 /DNA_ID=CAMNT_0016444395 /DNA_START=15 /DNA_END=752 /DNA_ORIENTATION=-
MKIEVVHDDVEQCCNFAAGDWVKISGLQSEKGKHLNGKTGRVERLAKPSEDPRDSRYAVNIKGEGYEMTTSIARKNLEPADQPADAAPESSVPSHLPKKADSAGGAEGSTAGPQLSEQAQFEIAQYLMTDPVGKKFFGHLQAGNAGFTTIGDPGLRPALRRVVEGRFIEMHYGSQTQKQWEVALQVADHSKGENVRSLLISFKAGITGAEYLQAMKDKELVKQYDRLVEVGLATSRATLAKQFNV